MRRVTLLALIPHSSWRSTHKGSPLSPNVTGLLVEWNQGNDAAREALITVVYEELRRVARRQLLRERPDHTLQSAALVNEAYLRLTQQREAPKWQNRAHFFGMAAQVMRQILVDHARRRLRAKRGGAAPRLSLETTMVKTQKREVDLVSLDDALSKLAALDPEQGRLVELRFFAGLSIDETAEVMGISPATVKREWATARAWLQLELKNATQIFFG